MTGPLKVYFQSYYTISFFLEATIFKNRAERGCTVVVSKFINDIIVYRHCMLFFMIRLLCAAIEQTSVSKKVQVFSTRSHFVEKVLEATNAMIQ